MKKRLFSLFLLLCLFCGAGGCKKPSSESTAPDPNREIVRLSIVSKDDFIREISALIPVNDYTEGSSGGDVYDGYRFLSKKSEDEVSLTLRLDEAELQTPLAYSQLSGTNWSSVSDYPGPPKQTVHLLRHENGDTVTVTTSEAAPDEIVDLYISGKGFSRDDTGCSSFQLRLGSGAWLDEKSSLTEILKSFGAPYIIDYRCAPDPEHPHTVGIYYVFCNYEITFTIYSDSDALAAVVIRNKAAA